MPGSAFAPPLSPSLNHDTQRAARTYRECCATTLCLGIPSGKPLLILRGLASPKSGEHARATELGPADPFLRPASQISPRPTIRMLMFGGAYVG
jgi:hypothetical protein